MARHDLAERHVCVTRGRLVAFVCIDMFLFLNIFV